MSTLLGGELDTESKVVENEAGLAQDERSEVRIYQDTPQAQAVSEADSEAFSGNHFQKGYEWWVTKGRMRPSPVISANTSSN